MTIGYELRCADPVPFDAEYVQQLGWGAVRYLLVRKMIVRSVDKVMTVETIKLKRALFRAFSYLPSGAIDMVIENAGSPATGIFLIRCVPSI